MPRRNLLTLAERAGLLALPATDDELIQHYTLAEPDLSVIRQRPGPPKPKHVLVHMERLNSIHELALPDDVEPLMLRKPGSYPRQNGLAVALRELGRIERTLFALD